MRRGEADVMRKVAHPQVRRGLAWRAHPVPYGEESYPWTVLPLPCAFCGTREKKAYRILRCDTGQTLVLHNDCGVVAAARLRMDTAVL